MKIDKYLSRGETVDKSFTLKGFDVHATNKRLFISSFNGNTVADYDYNHISSLVFNVKRYYWLIALGAVVLGVSLYLMNGMPLLRNAPYIWIGLAAGMGCIVLGIFKKEEYLKLYVLGVASPILRGSRANLDDLFRTIREKGENMIETTQR